MPLLNYGLADFVANTKAKASELNTKLNAIKTLLNVTKLDASNIQDLAIITALLADGAVTYDKLGANVKAILTALGGNVPGGAVARGKSITAIEQARTNVAYGPLNGTSGVDATDEVRDVVLPTDGLLRITFTGLWKNSVTGAGRAAIFIGSNQLKEGYKTGAPAVLEVAGPSTAADRYAILHSFPGGLAGFAPLADMSNVTTGQIVGGQSLAAIEVGASCLVFAAAGTYDISVQFKATSGSVTAKERKLWVEAVSF